MCLSGKGFFFPFLFFPMAIEFLSSYAVIMDDKLGGENEN